MDDRNETLLFLGLCYVYLMLALIWRMRYSTLIDADWFVESARGILDGSLRIYRGHDGHLPLFAITIAPLIYLADHVPYLSPPNLIGVVPIVFDLLCVYQFRRVLAASPLKISREARLMLYFVLLFSPAVFNGSAEMGHPESMMTFFILLGIWLRDKPIKSGIAFGLAQLTEHAALFAIVPFFLYLVSTRKAREWLGFALASTGTFALVFLPFLLADPARTISNVFTRQVNLQLIGVNFWTVLTYLFGSHPFLDRLAVVHSSFLMLALAVGISVWFFFIAKKYDIYGVVLVCMSLQLFFAKSVAPYHVVRTLFLMFCWDVSRRESGLPYGALVFAFGLALLRSLHEYQYVKLLHFLFYAAAVGYVFFNLGRRVSAPEEPAVRGEPAGP